MRLCAWYHAYMTQQEIKTELDDALRIRVPMQLKKRLKLKSVELDRDMSDIIRDLIESFLAEK